MVERLPTVPTLDAGRSLGGDHGRAEPERGSAGCPPNGRHAPIIRQRAQKGDSARGFWPFATVSRENDPLDRFLILLPLHDQDPPPRQCSRPAHESEITPGQTSDYWGSTSSWSTTYQSRASCWQTEAMTLTAFGKRWRHGTCSPKSPYANHARCGSVWIIRCMRCATLSNGASTS